MLKKYRTIIYESEGEINKVIDNCINHVLKNHPECTKEEIQACVDTGIEVEVFVHGALCICYSGQCYFSSVHYGRSGNRGMCAQPCRMKYTLYEDGNKVDKTTSSVQITNSTSVMMTTVAENKAAIGYISLGSLNDTVKAVKIDGAEASVDTVKDGSYKIVRPFNIVTKDKLSKQAQDFENYIMSADGQKIIQDNGYIKADEKAPAYKSNGAKGKVVVGGSSSVTPVMEKLKEAYAKANKDVTVEVQQSDSTTGVTNAIEGTCDIGMASRDLADSEAKKGVKATVIAKDGIAVIVNKDSKVDELTSAQVKDIYTGKTTKWADIK